MAMKKNYEPGEIEIPIYKNWEESGFFKAQPESNK